MQVVILAHGRFPDRAKTAVGVLRYADFDVVAVLDRDRTGERVQDSLPGVQDAPIVASMADIDQPVDALIIGIAPIGGGFDDSWRADIRAALERGSDVISGLHYFLEDDEEFQALAAQNGADLWDVRKPHPDIGVAKGIADSVSADIVLTVGTDCSVGKMTVSLELLEAAKARGIDAAFVPTGQTGIMIDGWGNPVDRVVSDFTAGSVEELILEKGDEHDYLFVEGQGSIVHPAYSAVTLGILHGSMPNKMVLCHAEGREAIHGYETFSMPPLPDYIDLYEDLAAPVRESSIVAGALNTRHVPEDAEARATIDAYADAIGVPATDPVRFDADEVLDAIL